MYWSEQSATGLEQENWCSLWGPFKLNFKLPWNYLVGYWYVSTY